jgi:hypothetical protein
MTKDIIRADQIEKLPPGSKFLIGDVVYIKAKNQPSIINSETGWVGYYMHVLFPNDEVQVIERK